MNKPKVIVTLAFISSPCPSSQQYAAIEPIKGAVKFRNASVATQTDSFEKADAYTGEVPEHYRKSWKRRFPETPFPYVYVAGLSPESENAETGATETNKPAATPPVTVTANPRTPEEQAQRDAEDAGAAKATKAQLCVALEQLGIKYNDTDTKAALLALYVGRS